MAHQRDSPSARDNTGSRNGLLSARAIAYACLLNPPLPGGERDGVRGKHLIAHGIAHALLNRPLT